MSHEKGVVFMPSVMGSELYGKFESSWMAQISDSFDKMDGGIIY